jgi:hypothetical protein
MNSVGLLVDATYRTMIPTRGNCCSSAATMVVGLQVLIVGFHFSGLG